MQFEQGKTYEFDFGTGVPKRLRCEGFGSNMHVLWRDLESGQLVHPLPPFRTFRQVE
jgi:hypothetical protein